MKLKILLAATAVGALFAGQARAALVNVDIYTGYSESVGSSISFSGLAQSFGASDINFFTGNGGGWWPLGFATSFGARITSNIFAPTTGSYNFTLGADDGVYVFIDHQLVGSQPGDHSYFTTNVPVTLTSGSHALEIQFFNSFCCQSGVDFALSNGAAFSSGVPEPSTWALMLTGLAGVGYAGGRRRERPAVAAA
jgi:hypothetical protein